MPRRFCRSKIAPVDVRLTQEAFHDANMSVQLHVASDVWSMAFLRKEGALRPCPSPDLILLDLNCQDGWPRVLAQIKKDESLKTIR